MKSDIEVCVQDDGKQIIELRPIQSYQIKRFDNITKEAFSNNQNTLEIVPYPKKVHF